MPKTMSLPQLRIASPCPARWEEMDGDEQARFCHQCTKHVYDLTKMSPPQIIELVRQTEGQFCGRLYRRADGKFLTTDCPTGLAMLRRRTLGVLTRIAAVIVLACGSFGYVRGREAMDGNWYSALSDHPFLATLHRWAYGKPMPLYGGIVSPNSEVYRSIVIEEKYLSK